MGRLRSGLEGSVMVLEDRPSQFQPGQRVRVRKEARDPASQPDERFLGKEGIVLRGPGSEDSSLTIVYIVEFDTGEVKPISPRWLESAE